jgi:hypothetical protein
MGAQRAGKAMNPGASHAVVADPPQPGGADRARPVWFIFVGHRLTVLVAAESAAPVDPCPAAGSRTL